MTRGPPVSPPLKRELQLSNPNWPLFIDRFSLAMRNRQLRSAARWEILRHLRKHSNEMVSRDRRQAPRTTKDNTSTAIFRRVGLISRRMYAGSIMIRTESAGVPLNARGIFNW